MSALEAKLKFLARRMYSQSWKMVACSCKETSNQRTSFRHSGLLPHLPQRDRGTGQGAPASTTALTFTPALAWDQHGLWAFQEGCRETSGAQQITLLCLQPTGKCRDLAVLEHGRSRSSQRIRAVRKSCQRAANPCNFFFFFFKLQHVILNCSILSSHCESCTTILPLCSHAGHSLDGDMSLAGLGTSLGCLIPGFRERFPCKTCVI